MKPGISTTPVITAESAVIGAALLNEKCAGSVFTRLAAEDFEDADLSACFTELQGLWKRDGRIDAATISRTEHAAIATACMETVPSVSVKNTETYIAHVADAARVRRAQVIALQMATGASTTEELQEACVAMQKALGGSHEAEWLTLADGFRQFYERQGKKPNYIRCGCFPTFDRYTYLSPGDYVIIGGRPSSGKTLVGLNLALGWAKAGHHVLIYSHETEPQKIVDRMISAWFLLNFGDIHNGTVATDDGELVQESRPFTGLNIEICHASGRSVAWMRAETARRGADIVLIDYIGLIQGEGKDRYEQVTNISLSMHEWAQSDAVLVVGLCQLNRQGVGDPKLSDLRESGQLEQDADVVVLLNKKTDAETGEVTEYTFDVAKNKDGTCGPIRMAWDGEHQRVTEFEYERT